MNVLMLVTEGDAVTGLVAVLLLAMSVASWVVIVWKAWLLQGAVGDAACRTAGGLQSVAVAGGHPTLCADAV